MIYSSQLGCSPGTSEILEERLKTFSDFDGSPLATLAVDLENRNYLDSLCCSLYGLHVSFVA